MKKTLYLLLLMFSTFTCFSQKSFYSDGIGFEYPKKVVFLNKIENGTTYIYSYNVEIYKYKMNNENRIETEQFVNDWANNVEEKSSLNIIQRGDIVNDTIGISDIPVKSITFEFKKKYFQQIYSFSKDNYIIAIIVNGKINSDAKLVLNSFYFMPEH